MEDMKLWLTVAGLLLHAGFILGGCVWAVGKIRTDLTEKIASVKAETAEDLATERSRLDAMFSAEREQAERNLKAFVAEFATEQKTQDHRFGEVALALREKIAGVEGEMHKIEIWSRDHYVQKGEFFEAMREFREGMRDLATDLKSDMKQMETNLDQRLTMALAKH